MIVINIQSKTVMFLSNSMYGESFRLRKKNISFADLSSDWTFADRFMSETSSICKWLRDGWLLPSEVKCHCSNRATVNKG